MIQENIPKIIEALLFVSPSPLSTGKISEILEIPEKKIREFVEDMKLEFQNKGINLREVAEGLELCTNPELYEYVEKLNNIISRTSLSKASMETLAIIAYHQPIIRAEIEEMRGAKSSKILSNLLSARLIRIAGRSKNIGKPFMYATTKYFLRYFGIKSLDELPKIDDFR